MEIYKAKVEGKEANLLDGVQHGRRWVGDGITLLQLMIMNDYVTGCLTF